MSSGREGTIWRRGLTSVSGIAVVLGFLVVFFVNRGLAYLVPGTPPWLAPIGFVLMAATPWIVFNNTGRNDAVYLAPKVVPSIWLNSWSAPLRLGPCPIRLALPGDRLPCRLQPGDESLHLRSALVAGTQR